MDADGETQQQRLHGVLVGDAAALERLIADLLAASTARRTSAIELLAAVAVYPGAFHWSLRILDRWRERLNLRAPFDALSPQLSRENSCGDLRLAALSFVGCLLAACESRSTRRRLWTELSNSGVADRIAQIKDESALFAAELARLRRAMAADGDDSPPAELVAVDLNSHSDIFYTILKQIGNTQTEALFLNILQHLLGIDASAPHTKRVWQCAEKLVARACLVESESDAEQLVDYHTETLPMLERLRTDGRCHCRCHATSQPDEPPIAPPLPPPPPPPPPPPESLVRPTAAQLRKLPFSEQLSLRSKTLQSAAERAADEPPPIGSCSQRSPADTADGECADDSCQSNGRPKLKTLAWNKVPAASVKNSPTDNVWAKSARRLGGDLPVDFSTLEELFCQTTPPGTMERAGKTSADTNARLSMKKSEQINLLPSKRSLNVNIFLKQFRRGVDELLSMIQQCNASEIGVEKMRSLMKILPEAEEVETLRSYKGERQKLATAEQFFLQLLQIPNYRLLIELMLLKEEFAVSIEQLKTSVDVIILAAQELKVSRTLQDALYYVLTIGNYLNSGGYGGNAAGFKMTSLWKLSELRANKPNMTLLHYVAKQLADNRPEAVDFPSQLTHLEHAAKLSIESVRADVTNLQQRADRLHRQTASVSDKVILSETDFLQMVRDELTGVSREIGRLERLRVDLADYFCEDAKSFSLAECFLVFNSFCAKFSRAITDNEERQANEAKAAQRRLSLQKQQLASLESEPLEDADTVRLRSRSLKHSASLVDILESGSSRVGNAIDRFEGPTRRSGRRRSAALATDRERPPADALVALRPAPGRSRKRFSLGDIGAAEQSAEAAANIDKQPCSAVFAKTRLAFTGNALVSSMPTANTAHVVGDEQAPHRRMRDSRSHSLTGSGDLQQMVEHMEQEQQSADSRRINSWRCSIIEDKEEDAACEPTAAQKPWRDRILDSMPDYHKYDAAAATAARRPAASDIDAVVEEVQRANADMDRIVVERMRWHGGRDSGIDVSPSTAADHDDELATQLSPDSAATTKTAAARTTTTNADCAATPAEHDEGFETESNSTGCSAPPAAEPELPPTTAPPAKPADKKPLPRYLVGTKATSARTSRAAPSSVKDTPVNGTGQRQQPRKRPEKSEATVQKHQHLPTRQPSIGHQRRTVEPTALPPDARRTRAAPPAAASQSKPDTELPKATSTTRRPLDKRTERLLSPPKTHSSGNTASSRRLSNTAINASAELNGPQKANKPRPTWR